MVGLARRAGNLKGIGLKRQRNAGGGQRLRGLGGWSGGNRGQAEGVDGERVGFSPNYSLTPKRAIFYWHFVIMGVGF